MQQGFVFVCFVMRINYILLHRFTNTTVSYAAQMDMNIVFIGFISDFMEQGKGFKCTISG